MEVYFISIFPVGGAEFPEGGPPALVAVATGAAVAGPAGVAIGVAVGLLLSRFGSLSTRIFRKVNGRIVADPSRMTVTASRVVWGHLACLGLDFFRGCLLSAVGLWVGSWIAAAPLGIWPLRWPGTLALLAIGATIPAGALVGSLGGWRKRGRLFGAGLAVFLLAFLVLG